MKLIKKIIFENQNDMYTHRCVIWFKASSYNAFVILITERNIAIELYIYHVYHYEYEIIFLINSDPMNFYTEFG